MKGKYLFQKIMAWIERLNNYPGCDRKELSVRVQLWVGSAYALLHVVLLTIAFLIFAPEALKVLIRYGYFLLITMTTYLILTPRLRKNYKLVNAIHLTILSVGTLITILYLGGIATSGGLIVACLAFVLCSVPFQDSKITLLLFLIFTFIAIVSGLFSSYFSAPASLTPKINSILFMVNTLSMSGVSLFLILSFIAQQRKLESLESEKLKELNEAKNRLFTNITHEFRTPLTIIQGMNNLIKTNPEEWIGKGTVKIESQTRNLLALVNQMLDLSKLEAGAMPVHSFQSDIINYLKYLSDSFISMAQRKDIQLNFLPDNRHFVMDFDQEKIMYIVSNLLSNALKYTPCNGTVELYAGQMKKQNEFIIKVSDNGPGIPPEHLPFVFDRFFRVEEDQGTQEGGSGLGLALVKELVKLLGGSVRVISSMESGTTFIVSLPVTNNAPEKEIIPNEAVSPADFRSASFPADDQQSYSENENSNGDLPILLVVEDSHDLKLYLKALLEKQYQLEFASNGKTGLQKAFDHIPDIIVSDVMMPVLDGISMLDILKNDIRTSHIPVVMLTAKADVDSRLIGLDKGADDYLAKPFNENELLIRLRKLIELRRVLHERYAAGEQVIPDKDLPENLEDSFIQKIRSVMEENLGDDNFDVHQLSRTLGMSRSQLYRKFKSLTNKSVIDYFWTLRLYKAKNLLQTTALNVSEVAWAVGFKNLSHFSRAFKDQFGMNPSAVGK
ncbi:MAG: ATP-binding protein [Bacteroidota bacterium]|nr:ATP-binding protein [Bacteroidota bacterium]